MTTARTFTRLAAPFCLVILAACQTAPTKKTAQAPAPDASAAAPAAQGAATQPAQQQGAPVAVFLADTAVQEGWTPVNIQSGMLYVNPQPIITRGDLTGVQSGTNKEGNGLLALELTPEGKTKIVDATTRNPNKRLALVVGRTMLAAPAYTTPVSTDHLIFAVGTEQNATAAARAIAGVPQDGSGDAGAATTPPANTAPSTGGAAPQ